MNIFLNTHVCYLFGILRTYGSCLEVTPSILIAIRKIRKL